MVIKEILLKSAQYITLHNTQKFEVDINTHYRVMPHFTKAML